MQRKLYNILYNIMYVRVYISVYVTNVRLMAWNHRFYFCQSVTWTFIGSEMIWDWAYLKMHGSEMVSNEASVLLDQILSCIISVTYYTSVWEHGDG